MKKDMCKQFWCKVKDYPTFGSKLRRFYELGYLVPQIEGGSILDLGCGDGTLLKLLKATTELKTFYGYDISKNLLKKVDKDIITKVYDCCGVTSLPHTDYTIFSGVMQYIAQDTVVESILRSIDSNVVFIKTPCVDTRHSILNKDSTVGKNYVSHYRTLEEVMGIVSKAFFIKDVARAYPDEIESKFGSLQYWIRGER